jgi:hypothetical protein
MNRADTMQAAVQRYLDERHRLGFALKSPGTELMRFVSVFSKFDGLMFKFRDG